MNKLKREVRIDHSLVLDYNMFKWGVTLYLYMWEVRTFACGTLIMH